jgi:hypothetical protein
MTQTEWNDPQNGAMDYEEYARDAIGILRQNGSDTHADAISRLLVRVMSLEAELAEARKDVERYKAVVDMWFTYVSLDGTETDDMELMLTFGNASDATKAARGAK